MISMGESLTDQQTWFFVTWGVYLSICLILRLDKWLRPRLARRSSSGVVIYIPAVEIISKAGALTLTLSEVFLQVQAKDLLEALPANTESVVNLHMCRLTPETVDAPCQDGADVSLQSGCCCKCGETKQVGVFTQVCIPCMLSHKFSFSG